MSDRRHALVPAWALRGVVPLWLATVLAGHVASTTEAGQPAGRTSPNVTLSIVGTNDLHGGVLPRDGRGGLALLGGYLKNLRAARAREGGAVLLIDAGDMFQGTLESNLTEGAPVVQAYNALGYTAAAIGNHEFDFGPVGDAATPRHPGDDARGTLKARAAEARFPFLAANIIETAANQPVNWPNVMPSTVVDAAGVRVGIIGVTTAGTFLATMTANTVGLRVVPLAQAVVGEAKRLRAGGAVVVVVTAHAGGRCTEFGDPRRLSSCDKEAEIIELARALPAGLVDVIVAGHTHAGMAHEVANVAVIEAFAGGQAFGRVDLTVGRDEGRVIGRRLFRPRDLCAREDPKNGRCDGERRSGPSAVEARYEGAPVVPDRAIEEILQPAVEGARRLKAAALGVQLDTPVRRATESESALGNLFADLMREAVSDADVAITNGGGLRADLPQGPLTYGSLYEAMPFDNRLVQASLNGRELKRVLSSHFSRGGSILSISGVRVRVFCQSGTVGVGLIRESGGTVGDDEPLKVVTSDFLATGGDGLFDPVAPLRIVSNGESDPLMRDAMAERLRSRGGRLREERLLDRKAPRFTYPGRRPMRCQPPAARTPSSF